MNEHNGLSEANILMLHAFLHEYEKHIKGIKKEEVLLKKYPYLRNFYNSLPRNFNITTYKKKDAPKELTFQHRGFYLVLSKKSKLLSLLYHVRNAFCHGTIQVEDQNTKISDYNAKEKYISAYAYLPKTHFITMLKIITDKL